MSVPQFSPVQPAEQLQTYALAATDDVFVDSKQSPPTPHGVDAHSSISPPQSAPLYPAAHEQLNEFTP
jgi:hypothetical protein